MYLQPPSKTRRPVGRLFLLLRERRRKKRLGPHIGEDVAVRVLELICPRAQDLGDDVRSFPRWGKLVHVLGGHDPP